MIRRIGKFKFASGVFVIVLLALLKFSTPTLFAAAQQNINGDVSFSGAFAVTDNPTSTYDIWVPKSAAGSKINIDVNYSCMNNGLLGFNASIASGGNSASGFSNSAACPFKGYSSTKFLSLNVNSPCVPTPSGNFCHVLFSMNAAYGPSSPGSGGHFTYQLTVRDSVSTPDISYAGNSSPTSTPGSSWSPGDNEFGLFVGGTGPPFNFQPKCGFGTQRAYLAWSGVDLNLNPSIYWTLKDNGTQILSENGSNLSSFFGDNSVHHASFVATVGHTYTWQWFQEGGTNEIVYSVPFSSNSFNVGDNCTPPINWSLVDSSSYNSAPVAPGQSANFTWQVQNLGPSPATYHWHIQQSYGGGSGSYADNGQTGSPANVPVGGYNPGPPPNIGNTVTPWPVGTGAPSGSKFCERIVYYYANGPTDTAATIGGPNCITLAVPTTPTCTYLPSFTDPGAAAGNAKLHSASFVRVVDSNGNQLVPQGGNPTQTFTASDFASTYPAPAYAGTYVRVTQSATQGPWSYTPIGTNITVYTVREVHNTDTVAHSVYGKSIPPGAYRYFPNPQVPNPPFGHDGTIGPCYAATPNNTSGACSLTVSGGNGPGGVVTAGQPGVTITGTIYNNNSSPYAIALPPNLPNGTGLSLTSGGPHYYGASIGVGQVSGPISWGIGINGGPNPSYQTVTAYPDYYGTGPIGPSCSITFPVYAPFTLTPNAQTTLTPTIEAPTSVNNKTWVTEGGAAVNENVTSSLYYTSARCGSPTVANTSNGGPFTPGSTTYLFNPGGSAYSYAPCTPLTAGDTYCSQINVPVASGGFVGPAGDIVGGTGATATSCPKVVNEPYYRVFNSGVLTGSSFPDSSGVCKGGELAGWNNNTGIWPASGSFGAGSQLNGLAAKGITGFGTNQNIAPALNYPPTNLSFANKNVPITTDTDSPSLGGYFGDTPCYQGPSPLIGSPNLPSADINALAGSGKASYTYTGNLDLYGGSINPGTNLAIYVTGNVYIHPGTANGIKYNGSGGWTLADIPSFVLSATGNIYIDPGVTELDGVYNAQPNSSNVGGNIYTCGVNSGGGNFTYMDKDSLYTACNNQLTVYGNFQANHVNLMRAYGSLRDETPSGGTSSYNATINGSNYKNCGPTAGGSYPCQINNNSVYAFQQYAASYKFSGIPSATNYSLTLNYSNFQGNFPPPPSSSYNYIVDIQANGIPIKSNFPLSPYQNSITINLGSVPPVLNVKITWKNNYWLPCGSNPTCYDPNFEIDSLQLNTPSTPSTAKVASPCSNQGVTSFTSGITCAAEVFDLSQELYLSQPSIEPPNHGTLQLHSLTSLPPIL